MIRNLEENAFGFKMGILFSPLAEYLQSLDETFIAGLVCPGGGQPS